MKISPYISNCSYSAPSACTIMFAFIIIIRIRRKHTCFNSHLLEVSGIVSGLRAIMIAISTDVYYNTN